MTFVQIPVVETAGERKFRVAVEERTGRLYRCSAGECSHSLHCRDTDLFLFHSRKPVDQMVFRLRMALYDNEYKQRFQLLKGMSYESGRKYVATHN